MLLLGENFGFGEIGDSVSGTRNNRVGREEWVILGGKHGDGRSEGFEFGCVSLGELAFELHVAEGRRNRLTDDGVSLCLGYHLTQDKVE